MYVSIEPGALIGAVFGYNYAPLSTDIRELKQQKVAGLSSIILTHQFDAMLEDDARQKKKRLWRAPGVMALKESMYEASYPDEHLRAVIAWANQQPADHSP